MSAVKYFLLTIVAAKIFRIYCNSVKCAITSHPVVLDHPLTIACRTTNNASCVKEATRRWMDGEGTLLINGYANDTKFKEEITSCTEFRLNINNFSESDLQSTYWCAVQFNECTPHLNLTSVVFEYHPTDELIEKNVTLTQTFVSLYVNIMKVFPLPKCVTYIGEENNFDFKQQTTKHGHLYQVQLYMTYYFHPWNCPIQLNMSCKVGTTFISILRTELKNCTSDTASDTKSTTMTRMFISMFVFLVVMACCISPLLSSVFRNRQAIWLTLKTKKKKCLHWRRPVLAIMSTVVSVVLEINTEVYIIKLIDKYVEFKAEEIINLVSLCVSSLFMTPLTLSLISNPKQISIRRGFRQAVSRFAINKIVCCPCDNYEMDNSTNVEHQRYSVEEDCIESSQNMLRS